VRFSASLSGRHPRLGRSNDRLYGVIRALRYIRASRAAEIRSGPGRQRRTGSFAAVLPRHAVPTGSHAILIAAEADVNARTTQAHTI
jgi:hypothetical protein